MAHYYNKPGKPERHEDVFPKNPVGKLECKHCEGNGYIYRDRQIEPGVDYSKSKKGRSIWVSKTYYEQCPWCDPENIFEPLESCPLCEGKHTNDNTCPYCDLVNGNLKTKDIRPNAWNNFGKDQITEYDYALPYEYKYINITKKELLKYICKQIVDRCKPYRKADPEEFQYHPLAYAYRRVLREIWA